MSSSNRNNPSIDPADQGTLTGAIRFMIFKTLQGQFNNRLPAKVIKYNRTTNRVQVEIQIQILTTEGEAVTRAQLASIPVFVLGGGGFMINFPLKTGDLGWVQCCDRDISQFLQNYQLTVPNTQRMFNFADGVFIPDVMKGYTINSVDEDNLVISTTDGTISISVSTTGININGPTVDGAPNGILISSAGVVIEGPLISNGGITITGDGGGGTTPINITGNFAMTGDFTMTGNMRVNGQITASGNITPND